MNTAVGTERAPATRATTRLDRLSAALPLLTVFVCFAFVYAWQAWLVATPYLFSDELKYTQIARSLAEGLGLTRRGEPASLDNLTELATAPAWLVGDASTAYGIAKAIGVVAMTSVVFPVYLLARMLVSRGWALFAAAGSAAIPALTYSTLIIEEPYAYPVAATFFLLLVRALVVRTTAAYAVPLVVALAAPFVRGQLATLVIVYALALAVTAWKGDRLTRWRAGWSRWDRAGAIVLLVLAVAALNSLFAAASFSWERATGDYKDRMLEYGLWAGGALTIGLGILQVVLALASLVERRSDRTPAERAFRLVLALAVGVFGLYTAAKAAHLSTVFGTRVAERNLIYLAPLVFVATAAWLARPRLRPLALAAAAVFVLVMLLATPIFLEYPYFEAPGFSILVAGNRELELPKGTLEALVLVAFAVGLVLAVVTALTRMRAPAVSAVLAVVVAFGLLAWNATGELYAAAGSNTAADNLIQGFPDPPTWVDDATKGAPTLYLGKQVTNANGIYLLEFWNRAIEKVWSVDGTAPADAGPIVTPDLANVDGTLFPDPKVPYVVADPGIDVYGTEVARGGGWRLYRVSPPLRLRTSTTGVYADGWTGEDPSGHSVFITPGNRPGTMHVTVSRKGWTGKDVPGRVKIELGPLVIGEDKQPALGGVTETREWTVGAGKERTFAIPTPKPPFKVEVTVDPTFVPAQLDPSSGETRHLGAVVDYRFEPRKAATR